jgi:hypothetical protein
MHKERERAHLLGFKEVCPFFPDGRIESGEQPDFVVHTQDRLVGIEHTEMFQPGPSHGGSCQAQESLRQRIVDWAGDLHRRAGGQPLHLWVLFHPAVEVTKQDAPNMAETIARFVGQVPIEPGRLTEVKPTRETCDIFPSCVALIQIYHYPGGKKHHWSCWSSDFVSSITRKDIQAVIERKECKLDIYEAKCSEVWLLIVADMHSASSTVELTQSAVEHRYQTRFDRVFFFWNWDRVFVELEQAGK